MEAGKAVAPRPRPGALSGIAEFTSAFAIDMAKEAARIGLDGVMVMPALVYSSKPHETAAHFRSVAKADRPAGHGLQQSADLQERRHAGDPRLARRLRDDRLLQGIVGRHPALHRSHATWSATASCSSPASTTSSSRASWSAPSAGSPACRTPFRAKARRCSGSPGAGRYDEAMSLYRWFMPLLHLDARPDLVQCIKLCEHIMGRGTHLTRPPRLALDPRETAEIEAIMKTALANRPALADVGLKAAA